MTQALPLKPGKLPQSKAVHTLLGSSWHLSEVALSNVFYRLHDRTVSLKCEGPECSLHLYKAFFLETLLQNNATNK